MNRFKAIQNEPKRSEFREKLNGFVNIYSFLSQIMPYGDAALESWKRVLPFPSYCVRLP